jgi:hypothetical protein
MTGVDACRHRRNCLASVAKTGDISALVPVFGSFSSFGAGFLQIFSDRNSRKKLF